MKYKLVCFDLDGTIIDETIFIWQTLHDFLGINKEERKKAMDDFMNKKITYAQWAAHDVMLWQQANATKPQLMEAIKPLKLMKGALETLTELRNRGLRLAVISGSLDIALRHVLPDYEDYFDDVYINKLVFDGDELVSVIPTEFDFEHKASALRQICRKEGIDVTETVFVGDHHNDVAVAQEAGMSIAFNCKSDRLAQVADHVVEKKDLREILVLIT